MTYRTNAKPEVTLDDVLRFVGEADLLARREIQAALNRRADEAVREAKEEFKVGDYVAFDTGKRRHPAVVKGHITEIRQKNFIVKPDHGGRPWRIRASIVRKAF